MLAFHLFPTAVRDGSASYALTCLRCLLQVGQWKLELRCLCTTTSASVLLAVFCLSRLKCFHRSNFPFVLGTRVHSILQVCVHHFDGFFPFRELRHFCMCFPEISEYTDTENRTSISYHPLGIPVKLVVVVAFSSRARILGECLTIHSLSALFLLLFKVEISLCTLIPLFTLGLVHSGSVSLDNCNQVFPDK